MADLQLKHIYKRYAGGVTAVSDFTLDIDDKEFIILVGPSGCGKSTTLRMVAGLEEISEGELYIGGRLVNDVAPKDRDIAMVFQNYALYPHMTVFENMAFGLKLRKTPKDEIKKRVTEAAKILDIFQHKRFRAFCFQDTAHIEEKRTLRFIFKSGSPSQTLLFGNTCDREGLTWKTCYKNVMVGNILGGNLSNVVIRLDSKVGKIGLLTIFIPFI